MTNKQIAEEITGRILARMAEEKKLCWQKPWSTVFLQNAISGKAYRGINTVILSMFGGGETHFATFNQVRNAGGFVKKGAKGLPIVFYQPIKRDEKPQADSDEPQKRFFLLKKYTVFALRDVETNGKIERKGITRIAFEPLEMAEKLAQAAGVTIKHGGNVAAYSPALHLVTMPEASTFKSREHYYATLFHELTHALGPECGEKFDASFGSQPYAKEELAAELGANFFLSYCGIDSESVANNSVAYFQNWLKTLADNPQWLISASSKASKRFELLLKKAGLLQEETEESAAELERAA